MNTRFFVQLNLFASTKMRSADRGKKKSGPRGLRTFLPLSGRKGFETTKREKNQERRKRRKREHEMENIGEVPFELSNAFVDIQRCNAISS